jgi:hypothetical protein
MPSRIAAADTGKIKGTIGRVGYSAGSGAPGDSADSYPGGSARLGAGPIGCGRHYAD